jgi:2-polyprenyl-3-methyl-5-hydroxy-6-metoxy-1,4-benzoquinol methylase
MSHDQQERERPTDSPKDFTVHMPTHAQARVDQDEEWCEVDHDGERRRIRLHDYHEIFSIPGLYEQIFYEELECASPQTVRSLLEEHLDQEGVDPSELTVLDVGAGNGMIGEEMADLGVGSQVAVDIIAEAAAAAERDRPEVYEDYFVVDLCDLPDDARKRLKAKGFNCLTTVAALGFGDIPPRAFAQAYNLVKHEGWVAFNIKEAFLSQANVSGFSELIERMVEEGVLEFRAQRRYRHRLSVAGDPLHYIAIVAVKKGDVDEEWVADIEAEDEGAPAAA